MDQEKAQALIIEIRDASQAVVDMAGRAQVVKSGETIEHGGPITEEWSKEWRKALRRERKAIKAWRQFVTGEEGGEDDEGAADK